MDRAEREQLQLSMVRLADGDRLAFEPVYRVLWPVLRRFAERALAGSVDAEDAAEPRLQEEKNVERVGRADVLGDEPLHHLAQAIVAHRYSFRHPTLFR